MCTGTTKRKWQAAIKHDERTRYLGYFAQDKEEDAARAFDEAALRLRGAQAYQSAKGTGWGLNFPSPTTETKDATASLNDGETKKPPNE